MRPSAIHETRTRIVSIVFALALAGVIATTVASAGTVSSREAECVLHWRPVPSPSPDPNENYLAAVAATAGTDVWAVGFAGPFDTPRARTLVEHWNGRRWRRVRSPNIGRRQNVLSGVAAVSPDDAWVVGSAGPGDHQRALLEHWDGNTWRVINGPATGARIEHLWSVAAATNNDVWAVGASFDGNSWRPLMEHWDGTSWQLVTSAELGKDDVLDAVAARASDDVWAVGSTRANPLVAHWDGTGWHEVPQPSEFGESYLFAVGASSATDVWTVGQDTIEPLVEHWDGGSLTTLRVPHAHWRAWEKQEVNSVFYGVSALSPNDVWMTGFRIEHWNGHSWQAGPEGGGSAIVALSKRNIWEVGTAGTQRKVSTRVMHYSCR